MEFSKISQPQVTLEMTTALPNSLTAPPTTRSHVCSGLSCAESLWHPAQPPASPSGSPSMGQGHSTSVASEGGLRLPCCGPCTQVAGVLRPPVRVSLVFLDARLGELGRTTGQVSWDCDPVPTGHLMHSCVLPSRMLGPQLGVCPGPKTTSSSHFQVLRSHCGGRQTGEQRGRGPQR